MKKLFFTFSAITLLIACSPKTAEVVGPTMPIDYPSSDVAEGDHLYNENCGKCHKFKTITKYSEEQWRKIVPKMAEKAKIDATKENKILQYVLWKRTL